MEFDLKLISKEINERMWTAHKTLSTAESCTAGRISSLITAIPGSSNYFRGGLICYQTDIKQDMLGVSPDTVAEHTVVSEEVAKEMVIGANKLFKSDIAVAITGYAGPGGADATGGNILVGNIWVAVGNEEKMVTRLIEEDNGREKNLAQATAIAMHMLRDYIVENCPSKIEETE